jgi:hypothetical protein
MYRNDQIASNPFACVFIYLINPPALMHNQNGSLKEFNWSMPRLTPQERLFISQLITSPSKELFKKTASQIMQSETTNLHNIDITALQVSIVEKLSELPHVSKVGVPCVLADPEVDRHNLSDETSSRNGSEEQKKVIEALLVGPDASFKRSMKPEFLRLAPPLHEAADELIWLETIEYYPELAWDKTLLKTTSTNSNTSELRKIILKAFKVQLHVTEQQKLENALSKDSSLIQHSGLTPAKV